VYYYQTLDITIILKKIKKSTVTTKKFKQARAPMIETVHITLDRSLLGELYDIKTFSDFAKPKNSSIPY